MNTKEITMRFSDLLAMVLKAARTILCLALILALLGGSYGAYYMLKNAPKVTEGDVRKAEEAVSAAEWDVISWERALVHRRDDDIPDAEKRLERAKLQVQRQQEYVDNSIYYSMNPFHRGICRLTFCVETNFTVNPEVAGLMEDPRVGIVQAYAQLYPFNSEILDQIRAIMKTDVGRSYIQELISIYTVSNRFVCIQVIHDDIEVAEQVVNYLYDTMVARLKGVVVDHSTNVIGVFSSYEVDWNMNDEHAASEDKLLEAKRAVTAAEESLADLKKGLSDKEQAVEDAKTALAEAEEKLAATRDAFENAQITVKNVVKKAVKYGVAGLVAGLMLGCCIALARGLFSDKVENQTVIQNRYSFPLIGLLPRTKKVWFDRTIRRLEGEPVGNFEATAQATAQSVLSRIGEKAVCLVTTDCRDIAEKLAACTEDRVSVLGNIIDDAASVRELDRYDGIILVEQRGKSRLDLVDAEVLRAKALDKEILGIVLA